MTEVRSRAHGEPTLLTFQRDDSIFTAVKTVSNPSSNGPAVHYDLLSVLFIAEALDVDIFPITWNTMLGPLGRGATGKVEQAVVDARTSFAFKRSIPARQQSDRDRYKAIISEIRALRDPVLINHPNIVELVGIGWDVNPEDATVWPVLLFRKAEFGTLKHFLSSLAAGDLSWDLKTSLCRDIVAGLSCLHRENILHGDLKPENVVVVDVDGKPRGQLIDFAFSSWGATDEDLVWLPKSIPWAAPEHDWREFTFFEGKKMDLFSLGMVCSFVLHNECWASVEEVLHSTDQTQSSSQSSEGNLHHPLCKLGISELLKKLNNDKSGQRGKTADEVFSFLERMLSNNPAHRDHDLAGFSQILASSVNDGLRDGEIDMTPESHIAQWVAHGIPLLHKRLELFDRGHFMVREAILASLKARACNETECPDCSFLAAIQVSFCYRIGFGTPRNVEDANFWAEDVQRRLSETEDLECMVQVFGQQMQNQWERTSHKSTSLQGLITDGLLDFNVTDQLLFGIPMDQVIAKVKTEGESRQAEFGEDHDSTMYYTLALSVLYTRSGKPELAEHNLRQVYKMIEAKEPDFSTGRHGVVQTILIDLLRQRGDLLGAKSEVEKQLKLMQAALGINHPDYLACLSASAQISADIGDYTSAIMHQEKVLAAYTNFLGKYHRDTIGSIMSLSTIYRDSGDLDRAELLAKDALERSEKVFGPDEYKLLAAKGYLATLKYDRGLEEEASKEFRIIFEFCERQLGLADERTLKTGTQLSSTLLKLGQLEEAEELTERLLLVSRTALGTFSQTTIALINNLGSLKASQGEDKQAQTLFLECVRLVEETRGTSSQELITFFSNLAHSYFRQGNHETAFSCQSRALLLAKRYYKPPHPVLALILANGGMYSFQSGKYSESIQLNTAAVSQLESIRGSDHPTTVESRNLIEKAKKAMQELKKPN